MTAASRRKDRGKRPDIEAELSDKYAVGWDFHLSMPTSEFDIDRSLANQARFQALHEDRVQEYQEAVERGDAFPAVIAYRPGRANSAKLVIIDGNHRLVAHDRAGRPVDVYEIDRTTKPAMIAVMNYAFNARHGLAISDEEKVAHAIYLIDSGASQEAAAAAVNVRMGLLTRALNKAKADQRAREVGLDAREWDNLAQSVKNRLKQIHTDEGYAAAAHLAYQARLNTEEVVDLTSLLATSKSAAKQRALVRAEADRLADRIQDTGGGLLGNATRTMAPKARVGMLLGQVLALPDDLAGLAAAYADAEREPEGERIMEAAEKLRKLAVHVNPLLK